MYCDERPRVNVIATSPHVHGTHDDRAAEQAVDHAIYARQVVAVATTSGDAPPFDGHRRQQEIVQHWWNRGEHEVWLVAARQVRNFNLSGMAQTLP
jgi:hypothetical protein